MKMSVYKVLIVLIILQSGAAVSECSSPLLQLYFSILNLWSVTRWLMYDSKFLLDMATFGTMMSCLGSICLWTSVSIHDPILFTALLVTLWCNYDALLLCYQLCSTMT
jgi:hypothetical protein